jgi:hypothetical protein
MANKTHHELEATNIDEHKDMNAIKGATHENGATNNTRISFSPSCVATRLAMSICL